MRFKSTTRFPGLQGRAFKGYSVMRNFTNVYFCHSRAMNAHERWC